MLRFFYTVIELNFTEIDIVHKNQIDSITDSFPPYCDFQFSNLLSWSLHKNPAKFSICDDNLIVEIKEYSTENVIKMFMGNHNVAECVKEILEQYGVLKRVPEEVISQIVNSPIRDYFKIEEDTQNNDYILDLVEISNLSGKKLKSKRQRANSFARNNSTHEIKILEPDYEKLMPIFSDFFKRIAEEKGEPAETVAEELEAVDKLLKYHNFFNLPIIAVYLDGTVIGFTINEILSGKNHETALGCFGKGLRQYKGIYAYLEVITARYLIEKGIKYINLEEDMGMEGLRESKRLWRPAKILKKYVISKNH